MAIDIYKAIKFPLAELLKNISFPYLSCTKKHQGLVSWIALPFH